MGAQVPFFKLLLPFTGGIIMALVLDFQFSPLQAIVVVSSLFGLLIASFAIPFTWAYRWVFGVVVSLFLFVAGFSLTQLTQSSSAIDQSQDYRTIARVIDAPEVRLSSTRVHVTLTMVHSNNEWKSVNEKSLLYFSASDSLVSELKYGDVLVLKSNFTAPPDAKNPYQFNYAKYLAKRNIYWVSFVPADHWMRVGARPHWLHSTTSMLRAGLLSLFQRVGIEGENLAVLSALTMGYKSLLDQETRRVFSASGAMHILAVSGLHVGILYATLSAFLFFFGSGRRAKLYKALLLILFLWFFAVFTGLSPSVMRASLMFSFVIMGTAFSHQSSIYNTLCASAFVMLVANPMLITEVGFQLSYLAVISIVFFYPYIYNLLYIKNRVVDKVWGLVAVSLAAQLGTFVLGLYYFNQFPNYFLLTNLFAIPMAFIILYLAIGLLVFSPIPILANALGWLLNESLSLLNYLVRFTEGLPYSTTTGISISETQAVSLLLAILMLAFLLENRKPVYLRLMLASLLFFFVENAYRYTVASRESELVMFAHRQKSLLSFREGSSVALCAVDTTTGQFANAYSFILGGYLNRIGASSDLQVIPINHPDVTDGGLRDVVSLSKNELGSWLHFSDKLIFIPEPSDVNRAMSAHRLHVDLMLITRGVAHLFPALLNIVSPKLVVVDETVPSWQLASISEHAKAHAVELYSIAQRGALVLTY